MQLRYEPTGDLFDEQNCCSLSQSQNEALKKKGFFFILTYNSRRHYAPA